MGSALRCSTPRMEYEHLWGLGFVGSYKKGYLFEVRDVMTVQVQIGITRCRREWRHVLWKGAQTTAFILACV